MSENSKIEWTDHTFNPWWGCQKVSEGCKNCYAETLDNRYNQEKPHWGPSSDRKPMSESYWHQPVKWNDAAHRAGKKAKVFCASMADVFEGHPQTYAHLQRLFKLIDSTPWLNWLLLTKRPENIMRLVPEHWEIHFPWNVWIGTSVENQAAAEERIPHLLRVPAAVRFLSCEPLLGPLDLMYPESVFPDGPQMCCDGTHCTCHGLPVDPPLIYGINWVIAGGESGPKARPMHPDWAKSVRDQCKSVFIPYLFKQWGEWRPYDHNAGDNTKPLGIFQDGIFRAGDIVWDYKKGSVHMAKVGKHAAGRLLDGVEHNEFPNPSTIKL